MNVLDFWDVDLVRCKNCLSFCLGFLWDFHLVWQSVSERKEVCFFLPWDSNPDLLNFWDFAETEFFAPDLLDYFYSMKDGFLNDISEDKDTCIQRLFCEFLSHEDPYVQNMASKW